MADLRTAVQKRASEVVGAKKEIDPDHCKVCGSENLFDGYWYRGMAIDQKYEPRAKWRTSCSDCGSFQDAPNRKPKQAAAKPRRVATPANLPSNPFAQHNSDTCAVCDQPIFHSVSMSEGSKWLHNDTYRIRCAPA